MCEHDHKNSRIGASLINKEAHHKDHKSWSRRTFLKGLGITGGASMFLKGTPVSALGSSPFGYLLNNSPSDRILVMVRLKGGNDGLNTVIPLYDYSEYANNRPQIRIPESEALNISNELALNPRMENLMPMWENGLMKVVNGVGYTNQNLSHFRSTDIWNSASDSEDIDESGWLGRFLENEYPDFFTNPPEKPPAVQIGVVGSILFNGMEGDASNYALSVTDPQELFEIAQSGSLYDVENLPPCYYGEQLGYVRTVVNQTFRYAEPIKEAYDNANNEANYMNGSALGRQLALVARLIKGGLGSKFYVVSLDGFDTHANQDNNHGNLLEEIATNMNAFYEDLSYGEWDKLVLSSTFSEFGRRLNQNASGGTDHGTAAPVMLFGPGLNGNGVVGDAPDLSDLDNNGNIKHSIDFRQIYTTILEKWLCIDPSLIENIMGDSFNEIDLGLECEGSVSVPKLPGYDISHAARYGNGGKVYIKYEIPRTMYMKLEIFNILGQPVQTLFKGRQSAGEYQFEFSAGTYLAPSRYVYRIEANGQAYSKVIALKPLR